MNTVTPSIPVFARWFGSWQIIVQRRALSATELTRRYDAAATGWQRTVDRLGFPAAYESLLRQVADTDTPATVLDCGVGTGALSLALVRVLPAPFALTAVDVSSRMLEQAQRALRGASADVTVQQADATALPYDDNSFDVVMTAHMLEHLADPADALHEMMRVLKPGGWLIVCVTRRSLLGSMVSLKWRTHRMTAEQARRLLMDTGLHHVASQAFDRASWCRRLSLACTGRKPLSQPHPNATNAIRRSR
jgi:ubiquinone/menaquinone biosynthesis C-methylase UbiE